MTALDNEEPEDPSSHAPRVTGSPDAIWLVYGDLEHDDTHAACCREGEVAWCEDAQFPADVRYTRTDLVAERVRAAVAAERARIRGLVEAVRDENAASQDADDCLIYTPALQRAWEALMAGLEGPNVEGNAGLTAKENER